MVAAGFLFKCWYLSHINTPEHRNLNETCSVCINLTLWHVHITIVAVEQQQVLHILSALSQVIE